MEVIMHPQTKEEVESFVLQPGHALGIRGEDGSDKAKVAKRVASLLLKIPTEKLADYPYILTLDVKQSNAGIDEVRGLNRFLKLKIPGSETVKRIVIINNIDFFRHEAQNALLKTMEEPPEDTVLIATFSRRDRVLQTMHSRMRQISVRPISLQEAHTKFGSKFNKNLISKAYYISDGQLGLMRAILNDQNEHEMLSSIAQARQIIQITRYKRLAMVDQIIKNKNSRPEVLIDAIYRLIYAGYKNSLEAIPQDSAAIYKYVKRLSILEKSISDLQENVHTKLVLSRLFTRL